METDRNCHLAKGEIEAESEEAKQGHRSGGQLDSAEGGGTGWMALPSFYRRQTPEMTISGFWFMDLIRVTLSLFSVSFHGPNSIYGNHPTYSWPLTGAGDLLSAQLWNKKSKDRLRVQTSYGDKTGRNSTRVNMCFDSVKVGVWTSGESGQRMTGWLSDATATLQCAGSDCSLP